MSLRLYLPADTTALALGADAVAAAIRAAAAQRALAIDLVRNGSRGVFWLEPLLEVERGGQRIAFGPLQAADIPGVLAALDSDAIEHPLYLGPTRTFPGWPPSSA